MRIRTLLDLAEDVGAGQRWALLQRRYDKELHKLVNEMMATLREAGDAYVRSRDKSFDEQFVALRALYAASQRLSGLEQFVAQYSAVDRRLHDAVPSVADGMSGIAAVARLPIPKELLPQDSRDKFVGAAADAVNPERAALGMLRPGRHPTDTSLPTQLAAAGQLRTWTLHTMLLTRIAAAGPDENALEIDALDATEVATNERARGLRDRVRELGRTLARGIATPDFGMSLWLTLHEFETWWTDELIGTMAKGLAAATWQVQNVAPSTSERWARTAAKAYDAARVALAYSAGLRALTRAYALGDERCVSTFEARSRLNVASTTLDLPRTAVADVAKAAEGDVLELAAVVKDASYVVGGPRPRTVLTVAGAGDTTVRVLVPFVAADSFGVVPGVWIQARGTAFPVGKDDLAGPVLQVRRIKHEQASAHSFGDWLTWMGRDAFELRPGGLDLVAGREAGNSKTLAEAGLRA